MPTILTHAVIPVAARLGLGKPLVSNRLLMAGMAAAVIPDLDVIAFRIGIPYADAFGHRGASHSLVFALLMGLIALMSAKALRAPRWWAFAFVALSGLSHGLLDMLTDGGHGVALWWPFSEERVFFAAQVIEVSPLSLRRVLSGRGWEVLQSELVWVWLPAMVAAIGIAFALAAWRRTVRH